MESNGKKLSPEAAEYYKRAVLIADRYTYLLKKHLKLRMFNWFLIAVVAFETLKLFKVI